MAVDRCGCGWCSEERGWRRYIEESVVAGRHAYLATEATASASDSIEHLKPIIKELTEKQQNTLFCWMHDALDCRRFKE
jgi:hypothetical protein